MSAIGEINELKEAYVCNLASFKEYYVLTKLFPQDNSYLQKFTEAKGNMIKLSKSLFLLNNQLSKNIENMNKDSKEVNRNITDNQTEKDSVEKELDYALGQVGGAEQLSHDYKKLYTDQYILNWSFVIGGLAALYATYYTFSLQKKIVNEA